MEMLQFQRRWLDIGNFVDEFYVLDPWMIDIEDLSRVKAILDELFKASSVRPLIKNMT